MSKIKAAIAWNSSCGGCDESIVDIEKRILDIVSKVEFILWPCAMDFKYADVEALADNEITVSLINGGIQNTHQEHVVKLLRKKSKVVVAFGSCAAMGGIPSLANLTSMEEIFQSSYINGPTNENPDKILPQLSYNLDGCELTLPRIFNTLHKLDDIIKVDYYLPGCPPTADMIAGALGAILEGKLPAAGSILAPDKSLCASCNRNETKPDEMCIKEIKRIHQVIADPALCFLVQGIICMGPATRDGCDYPCVKGNMPCTGCMGAMSGSDQGAKMSGTLAALFDGDDEQTINHVIDGIKDPAGTFYRYSTAASLLGAKRKGD